MHLACLLCGNASAIINPNDVPSNVERTQIKTFPRSKCDKPKPTQGVSDPLYPLNDSCSSSRIHSYYSKSMYLKRAFLVTLKQMEAIFFEAKTKCSILWVVRRLYRLTGYGDKCPLPLIRSRCLTILALHSTAVPRVAICMSRATADNTFQNPLRREKYGSGFQKPNGRCLILD